MSQTIYDFTEIAPYRGKVVLVVNVASKCGYTYQYEGLEALYKKYSHQGLVILGFPCNQFGHQEPGSEEEIKSFCKLTYDVTFPILKKIDVNGPNAHPLFEYLKKQRKGFLGSKSIKWNFTKFLIDRNGKVISRIGTRVKPEQISGSIENLL